MNKKEKINFVNEDKIIKVGLIILIIFEILRYLGVSENMFYAILLTSLLCVFFIKVREIFSEIMLEIQYTENKGWIKNYLKCLFWLELISEKLKLVKKGQPFLYNFDINVIEAQKSEVAYKFFIDFVLINNLINGIRFNGSGKKSLSSKKG